MAETRESLKALVAGIAKDIDEGKDMMEIAESLEEATGVADAIATRGEGDDDS